MATAFPLLPAFEPSPSSSSRNPRSTSLLFSPPPPPLSPPSPASSASSSFVDPIFIAPSERDDPTSASSITTTPRSSLDSLRSVAASPFSRHFLPPLRTGDRCPHAPLRRRSRRSSLADDLPSSHHHQTLHHGFSPYPKVGDGVLDARDKRRSWCGGPVPSSTLQPTYPSPAKKLRRSPAVAALNVFTSLAFAESSETEKQLKEEALAKGKKHGLKLGDAFQFGNGTSVEDEEIGEYQPLSSVPFPVHGGGAGRDTFDMDDLKLVSPLRRALAPSPPAPPPRASSSSSSSMRLRPAIQLAESADGLPRRKAPATISGGTVRRRGAGRLPARQLFL